MTEPVPQVPPSSAHPGIVVGLVAAPGAPAELSRDLADDLLAELTRQVPGVSWRVEQVVDGLASWPTPPAGCA